MKNEKFKLKKFKKISFRLVNHGEIDKMKKFSNLIKFYLFFKFFFGC